MTRYVFPLYDGRELVAYAHNVTEARARVAAFLGEQPPCPARTAGVIDDEGRLHLPPGEQARLVTDDRRAPGS